MESIVTKKPSMYEECARIAEVEAELPGAPPKEMLDLVAQNPVGALRAVVRATKKSIAARIRNREHAKRTS